MSRIGKKPITITEGVTVTTEGKIVRITGPKGELSIKLPEGLKAVISESRLEIETAEEIEKIGSLMGLYRSLINNAVCGVKNGWTKTLELVGVGFRAQTDGKELILSLGFSHPVKIVAPEGISFKVEENKIIVSGVDKYLVGQVTANIRMVRRPEPYKGKGIRYIDERIRKKLGKAAKAVGGITTAK